MDKEVCRECGRPLDENHRVESIPYIEDDDVDIYADNPTIDELMRRMRAQREKQKEKERKLGLK